MGLAVGLLHTSLLIISGVRIGSWLDPPSDLFLLPTEALILVGLPLIGVCLLMMIWRTRRYLRRRRLAGMLGQVMLLGAIVGWYSLSPGGFRSYPVKAIGLYFGDGPKMQAWATSVISRPADEVPFVKEPAGDVVAAFADAERRDVSAGGGRMAREDFPEWMRGGPLPNVVYVHPGSENSYLAMFVDGPYGSYGFLVGRPSFSIGYAKVGICLWPGVYYGGD
jgi:hypothetical protein